MAEIGAFVPSPENDKLQQSVTNQRSFIIIPAGAMKKPVLIPELHNGRPDPDQWEVGPYFAHHRTSCTPLHPYVTLQFEMLLFHFLPIWALEPHILLLERGKRYAPF